MATKVKSWMDSEEAERASALEWARKMHDALQAPVLAARLLDSWQKKS